MQPIQALQDMLRMLSRVCCKRIGCTEAGRICAMTFADAFFVENYTVASTNVTTNAPCRVGGAEGVRVELKRAVADLGASPDRFSSLASDSIVELKRVGKRLVTRYNDVVCALKCECPISLDAALQYEISLAEFCATHAKLCRNNANSLQSKLNAHMLRVNVSMERTYKRARIIVAIKRGAVFFGQMPVAIARHEEQVGKLVPYIAKKLSVLMQMAGSAARTPLIDRVETVLAAVLSSTSTQATVDAARAIGILFQSPVIMSTISKRSKNNNYGLRPLDALFQEPICINGWDVVAVALREGSTGAAACLLDEVIETMKLIGVYSECNHGGLVVCGGKRNANALLASSQHFLELAGPFLSSLDPSTLENLDDALCRGLIDLPGAVLLFIQAVTNSASKLRCDFYTKRILFLKSSV